MPSITNEPPKSMRGGQQRWSGKTGLECFRASVYNLITKTSAERTRLKRAVLVGGHLARLAIPKDCEHGRRRGEDVAALLFFWASRSSKILEAEPDINIALRSQNEGSVICHWLLANSSW